MCPFPDASFQIKHKKDSFCKNVKVHLMSANKNVTVH